MAELTRDQAHTIVATALKTGRERSLKPLAVAVYDARGALKAFEAEDGTSLKRGEIAMGKAYGAIALGVPSRTINAMAQERPHFVGALSTVVGGSLVPVPGGVLVRDGAGALVGAVGISGDTSDNDEIAAVAGIEAAGLKAETGA
ncbi:heme-binding protein [Salinarimonas sp.]|uniref:GlcG/HbpS family heme-binding protein n=1 Tax=Salinarimonas sp. TaxID=2766526 RepID=UPI0032D93745